MKEIELDIIKTFSEWIAFSGTRVGSPLRSRKDVYPLIRLPNYDEILKGEHPISKDEFEKWHRTNSELISNTRNIMPIGWATKLINLYLKAMVYLGGNGRPNLKNLIHPPIDNGLWDGILKNFKSQKEIIELTHSKNRIKNIKTYEDYKTIISGMELISLKEKIRLIEVEKYWEGTSF